MSLLTQSDIVTAINNGTLIHNGDVSKAQTCSYDMTVGTIFRDGQVFDSAHPPAQGQVVIEPGEVVTMLTREEVHLPNDIAATAYAMNSLSSEGFLVLNPGHVDPGYKGPLEIKAVNFRKVPLALSIGDPVFTVVFQKVGKQTPGYQNNVLSLVDKVRNVRKKEVEQSAKSISNLVALTGPFQTEDGVKKLIATHWMTWAMIVFAFVAMLASLVAAIPVIRGESSKQEKTETISQNSATPTAPLNSCDKSKSIKSMADKPTTERPCIKENSSK